MGDEEGGAAGRQLLQRRQHVPLRAGVQRAGGLVAQQDGRFLHARQAAVAL